MKIEPYAVWLICGMFLMLLEFVVPGLVIIWFGIGALFAGFVAYLGGGMHLQVGVFVLVSILSLMFVRKFFAKDDGSPQQVGAERLIGRKAIVLKGITPEKPGFVKVEGEEWLAKCDEPCQPGESVEILKVEGTHLIVKK